MLTGDGAVAQISLEYGGPDNSVQMTGIANVIQLRVIQNTVSHYAQLNTGQVALAAIYQDLVQMFPRFRDAIRSGQNLARIVNEIGRKAVTATRQLVTPQSHSELLDSLEDLLTAATSDCDAQIYQDVQLVCNYHRNTPEYTAPDQLSFQHYCHLRDRLEPILTQLIQQASDQAASNPDSRFRRPRRSRFHRKLVQLIGDLDQSCATTGYHEDVFWQQECCHLQPVVPQVPMNRLLVDISMGQ